MNIDTIDFNKTISKLVPVICKIDYISQTVVIKIQGGGNVIKMAVGGESLEISHCEIYMLK